MTNKKMGMICGLLLGSVVLLGATMNSVFGYTAPNNHEITARHEAKVREQYKGTHRYVQAQSFKYEEAKDGIYVVYTISKSNGPYKPHSYTTVKDFIPKEKQKRQEIKLSNKTYF